MADTKLVISGPTQTKEVIINPKGVTLGRGSSCDVILEHPNVSRLHARVSQDPFGRWIVEDLGSHNAIFIDGQRIKTQAVLPNQKITIDPFSISILQESDHSTLPGLSMHTAMPIIDKGSQEDIVSYTADRASTLSPALVRHLNELASALLKLSSPSELYSQACLSLAKMLDTLVAVVRLPCSSEPLPTSPDILACHFGDDSISTTILEKCYPHFSKRVLEAVRSTDAPLMASSRPTSGQSVELTILDEYQPHIVFSARVNELGDSVDALYIDVLEDKSPQGLFDFVEAAARQINFVQKNLFLAELEKQEKALREANIQLREKDRIKDEYVVRVTHDIKGHLAAIQSSLYVAGDKSSGPLNDRQSDFLNRALNRTVQLTNFVKELLNLTQMRLSGRIKMEAFSLPDVISKSLASVSIKAKEKSITVTSKIDPSIGQVIGDEFSINEMLTDLLFNAVKYTPENKSVHFEAKACDDSVQIDIADTGIGIPADELGHVFDEFFRASNAKKREKDGTGLGLSIVKQIVDRHNGKISVQSQEGKGTTFTVTLPKI